MRLYRLCRLAFRTLDGEGGRLYGGRWNTPGRPVVYTSTTLALAALEYLVHVDATDVPADLVALTIEMPDDVVMERLSTARLPKRWMQSASCPECQALGDAWLASGKTALLSVPSAPVPEERNVLINPRHSDSARLQIIEQRKFVYDPRLIRRR